MGAAPFRANVAAIKWVGGCPAGAECCSEYGYCRAQAEWAAGAFRDCNGISNGRPLAPDAIAPAAAAVGTGYALNGAGYGYAAAPAAVGTGYGYAAAAPDAVGAGYGYAAVAPAAVGTGYGYAAAAPAGYANTGYVVSGY